MKTFKILSKTKIFQLFLIFSFLICWLSVSTSFEDLSFLKKNFFIFSIENILEIVNFFRFSLVYFCFLFLLLIFINLNYKKKINFKESLIFYTLTSYFIFQLPGLFLTENYIYNIHFIISAITFILTIILINHFFNETEKKIFILISFLILLIVFMIAIVPKIIDLSEGLRMYGGYDQKSKIFAGKSSPRSSGLARTSLILFLFLGLFYFQYLKKNSIFVILRIFFISTIFLLQSRVIFALSLICLVFIFVYENKFLVKNLIKFISLYLIIPLGIFLMIINFSEYTVAKKAFLLDLQLNDHINPINKGLVKPDEFSEEDKVPQLRLFKSVDFTSGRISDWLEIKSKFEKNNILLGYGSQGDRFLINQTASNGLIYSFSSAGIIGLFFFITFTLIILNNSIKSLIFNFKKKPNYDYLLDMSIIVILIRSLVESSYAVFGLDFLILTTLILFKKSYYKKN